MADISGEAFVKAIQSETITLLVGPNAEPLTVSKVLLCHRSDFFTKHLRTKPDLTELLLPGIGVAISKMFVCWCYQERLQSLGPKPTPAQRKEWKELLIDLWMFADIYGIPKLQNQAMEQLTSLFVTPTLLISSDIEYIWDRATASDALKILAICTLVAQLEAPNAETTIGDYEELSGLPQFMLKLYKALHLWMTFEVPAKLAKKKWALMLQSDKMQKGLRVTEVQRGIAGGLPAARGVQAAEGAVRPFTPGEIIEID